MRPSALDAKGSHLQTFDHAILHHDHRMTFEKPLGAAVDPDDQLVFGLRKVNTQSMAPAMIERRTCGVVAMFRPGTLPTQRSGRKDVAYGHGKAWGFPDPVRIVFLAWLSAAANCALRN
jgi:hypothetical protein